MADRQGAVARRLKIYQPRRDLLATLYRFRPEPVLTVLPTHGTGSLNTYVVDSCSQLLHNTANEDNRNMLS
ncbi:hypothetical protein E2C01_061058 [Portunus trituberculatus]|uniref:Uncharacterized protein n=1 Tax=Portunus trituberculatus TaxID=210409 RepID=A0A5B7H9Q9_PORTR|nr:hypothetical protein [Portunus trituberculatus]